MPACSAHGCSEVHHKNPRQAQRTSFYIYLFGYFTDLLPAVSPKAVSLICFSIVLPTPTLVHSSTQHCGDWPCRVAIINQGRLALQGTCGEVWDIQVVMAGGQGGAGGAMGVGWRDPEMLLTTHKA